ncbi:hypothetical protein CPT76_11480 [Paenibacillus sp. AR247]|nr:hypothetical protein CPT76_11480 [Paenibacillus sp. AR247]
MFNPFEVAELMVQHISTNFPDDVSLIGYYGSRAQGTATERSDLDFFLYRRTRKVSVIVCSL